MAIAKDMTRGNETFIVQASLMIIAYDHQNIFIVQPTDYKTLKRFIHSFKHFG